MGIDYFDLLAIPGLIYVLWPTKDPGYIKKFAILGFTAFMFCCIGLFDRDLNPDTIKLFQALNQKHGWRGDVIALATLAYFSLTFVLTVISIPLIFLAPIHLGKKLKRNK